MAALRDESPEVRQAAAAALKIIGRSEREAFQAQPVGLGVGQVALSGARSVGCLIQLVFGLLALTALVLKILLAFR